MPTFPDDITYGQKYSPAMEITSQAEADSYFRGLAEHQIRLQSATGRQLTVAEAEAIERSNLAYFAGYYDAETRERVERLFRCAHPVFGAIAVNGSPTPEAAFKMGQDLAEEHKKAAVPTLWDRIRES